METVFYFAAKFVQVIREVVSIAMIVRMLVPIFTGSEDNKLCMLAAVISEPFIAPVRALMVKFNIGQGTPFDWSFFATYLIIWLLQMFLPAI